ncbi:MAG: Ig-like domain-containing protein, partial [bacterium]
MRFPLRFVFLLSAIFALAVAAPASAQYMYLDANGNGIHDTGDQLNPNGTATPVDLYLITDHNRDGSTATCNQADGPLSMISYAINLQAGNGTATFGGFTNLVGAFTIHLGSQLNTGNGSFKDAFGGATPLAAGSYKLASLTITGQTGSPKIDIVDQVIGSQDYTSFGCNCSGNDFDNTYKLSGPAGGTDWTDVDGLTAAAGGGNVNPTLTVLGTVNGAENSPISVTATATDPDAGNTLTISQTSTAPFLTFSHSPGVSPATATMSGTPSFDQAGSYTINWSVSDGAGGSDTKNTAVNIAQTNRPPVLAAIGNRTVPN